MCIAIYKDAEASPIKKAVLQTCFENNPDGSGYAWWDKEKEIWIARKGLMTFNQFWKSFNAHKFQKKDTYICHFRIGTSGNKKGPDCTHPFPVTGDCEAMRELEFETSNLVVHNGVHGGGDGTISDTMLAVRDWVWTLFPMINDKERGERVMEIMTEGLKLNSNRWLITEGFEVILIGGWKKDEDTGIRFSNEGWKRPRYTANPRAGAHRNYTTPGTTGTNTSTKEVGVSRVWSGDFATKYMDGGSFNWLVWMEDHRQHLKNVAAILESKSEQVAPNENEIDEQMVSPSLTCAYKDEPATVMGLVDNNGDVEWEDSYNPAEDLLICPHCKEDQHLIAPKDANPNLSKMTADTLCQRCGCFFMDEDGAVVGFDFDIRKEYQDGSASK
jgi:hypothetical protein